MALAWNRSQLDLTPEQTLDLTPEESTEFDHQSNGLADVAVREVKGIAIANKVALEENYNIQFSADEPILTWLVTYSAAMITRCREGRDGKTAWMRMRGRPYRKDLPDFGEKVLYQPIINRDQVGKRWDTTFHDGVFCGIADHGDEVVVTTPGGCLRARTFRRRAIGERYDLDYLRQCKGVPWAPVPSAGETDRAEVNISLEPTVAADDPSVPQAAPEPRPPAPQRANIRKHVELRKYGYTPGCVGCKEGGYRGTRVSEPH